MPTTPVDLETKTGITTSTRIAVGFVVATAIMVVASFAAAVLATLTKPNQAATTTVKTAEQTATQAASGVTLHQTSLRGVFYDEAVLSTGQ